MCSMVRLKVVNALLNGVENKLMLKTKAELGLNYYNVIDQGFAVGTEDRVWGSEHGYFQFMKQ